jgi:hypothetical protein
VHGFHRISGKHRRFCFCSHRCYRLRPNFAGIGVLMGVLGAAIGNFFGLGMGAILNWIVSIMG